MIAVLINGIGIFLGGLIGFLFKKVIKEEKCNNVLKAIGMVVIFIAIAGALKSSFEINEDFTITTRFELLLIICMAIGTFIGEILNIDGKINNVAQRIEKKFTKDENSTFAAGFINATIVFCVGAMAIVGSINAALGDNSVLYLKTGIDFVTAIVLGSTLGYGVMFAIFPVIIYQGLITILGYIFGDFMANEFICAFSTIGYIMVMAIGINFVTDAKIKIANMLPSFILIIGYYLIK